MNSEFLTDGITLVLGGARSGKSAFAERTARDSGKSVLFIATATADDDEMKDRIRKHQATRPPAWQTLELPRDIGRNLNGPVASVVILDCITLLVSNIILSLPGNTAAETVLHHVQQEINEIIAVQARCGGQWLIISNEVGLGLVPPNPLGRIYRDALGFANQSLAKSAGKVVFMVAGIPMVVK